MLELMLQKTNTIVFSQTQKEKCFLTHYYSNNADGFHDLFQKISSLTNDFSNVKVGLEATGHYNYNLLGFYDDVWVNLQSYSNTSYHNEELKSLTRYRFDKVQERAKLKTSISRLVNILFP